MNSRPCPTTVGGGRHLIAPDSRAGVINVSQTGFEASLRQNNIPAFTPSGTPSVGGGWVQARCLPPNLARISRSWGYVSGLEIASKIPTNSLPSSVTALTISLTSVSLL